jgi:hypothetical protein
MLDKMNSGSYSIVHTFIVSLILVLLLSATKAVYAGEVNKKKSPHYTEAGFFDIHVCNWPNRRPFFMTLLSTTKFADIEHVEVFYPDKTRLTDLDLSRYRLITTKNKPEKRVFIKQDFVPLGSKDGWYTATITLKDGSQVHSKDYVHVTLLPQATGLVPNNRFDSVTLPGILAWEAVEGARYYQVFLRDMWNEEKIIFESKLITDNSIKLPAGLLEPGGYYTWKVHARNVNEDFEQGDFNHGSISDAAEFTVME